MSEAFRKLVSKVRRGGDKRRRILEYIASHPGTTPYKIAKDIYGDGKYTPGVLWHLKKLSSIGIQIFRIERDETGAFHIYLTDEGRNLCRAEGLYLPSGRAELFIREFNKQLDKPLSPQEIVRLHDLLSEKVLDALEEIAQNSCNQLALESRPSPLDALWLYDAERNELWPTEQIKSYVLKNIRDIFPVLRQLPKELTEQKAEKVIEIVELDKLIKENLMAIPIAKKHRVVEELDELVKFMKLIIERGEEAKRNREKNHKLYAYGFGASVVRAIFMKWSEKSRQTQAPRSSEGKGEGR